jgi:hypothetical protein
MRPSQKQNRARGRGNRNKPSGNVVNRVFESAGPEGKVRGTPQQIIDKYLTLSRDAQTSGDRVVAENFLQHAEHYQRILLEAQGYRDEQRRDQRQDQDGADGDGRDDSGRDETGADEAEEAQASHQRDERRDDRRGREDRPDGEQRVQSGGGQRGRKGGERREEAEVSGLTTIDSGSDDGDNLLVESEELTASQPPRRRRNQRRDRGQEAQQEAEKSEADAQTE